MNYHTSMDTPDRLEKDVMRRNASILLTAAYMLGNAGERDFDALCAYTGDYAQKMGRESANHARRSGALIRAPILLIKFQRSRYIFEPIKPIHLVKRVRV